MDPDIVGAGDRWIPEEQYQFIQRSVPIVCVDVLLSPKSDDSVVGLIHRETYDGGFGWCLVGGAVLRNETLIDAVERHVTATLGPKLVMDRRSAELRTVIEYFSDRRVGQFHDPRKHAVALTFVASCEGEADPTGEALAFEWFKIDDLTEVQFGFGQGGAVARVLAAREIFVSPEA